MKRPHVLVVDDEEDIRLNLEAALGAALYDTTSVASGLEAMEAIGKTAPDLVILDIMMPDIDGYEVLRRIKENEETRHIAVVFASALKKPRNKIEGLDLGADDYITKPYNMDELLAKLRALFRIQDYQRRLERLVDFAHTINRLEYSAIAEAIVAHIESVLPTDQYSLFVTDDEGNLKLLAHNHGEDDMDGLLLNPADSPLMREVIESADKRFVVDFGATSYHVGDGRDKYEDGYALCLPLKVGPIVLGAMNLNGNSKGFFNENDFHYAQLVVEMISASLNNARLLQEQKKLATTDGLTRLTNHRHFHNLLAAEFERHDRYTMKLSCILTDIDHFKGVNDTYGHVVGDQILQQVAARLAGELRVVDSVARYGGEEFVMLLPESDAAAAERVAERIRKRIAGEPFDTDKGPLTVTISLGVCDTSEKGVEKGIDLVNKADTALYAAKEGGRNRVVMFNREMSNGLI